VKVEVGLVTKERGRPGPGNYEPVRLTSDFVFKYVFGSETSTNILRSFLTAVQTDAGLPAVAEVDVRARDVNGTVYTVGVNIVDFTIFPKVDLVHTTFHLVHQSVREHSEPLVLTNHQAIHFLELSKLRGVSSPVTGKPHVSTTLQRWLYYMHERGEVHAMEDPILLQILKEDPDIEDAEELYQQFVANDELREKYQDRIKAERDRRSQIIYARREGEKQGREEGRRELVRQMKSRGMSPDEIANVTGLSSEEIEAME
jgi:predicted transposase/invertase (TIGR01784 family)